MTPKNDASGCEATNLRHVCFGRKWRMSIRVVRWYFGLGWLIFGLGGLVAVSFLAARGDWLWIYMLIGAPTIVALGFVVHPWGLERAAKGLPLVPPALRVWRRFAERSS